MSDIHMVIFDCDGVIVDSEGLLAEMVAESLTAHGLPISAHEVHERFVGGTMYIIAEQAIEAGARLPEDWVDTLYLAIFERLRAGVAVTEGFVDLLDELEERGVKIAVASNGPMDKMRASMGASGLFDRLEGRIYSAHDYKAPKPKPDMLLTAAKDAGVAIENCVMVDDSPAGIGAARAANMRAYGYAEHGNKKKLKAENADLVYSMAELRAKLLN